MSSLTPKQLRRSVAKLLIVRASGHQQDNQRRYPRWELGNEQLKRLLNDGVGGVILLGGSAVELQQRTLQLQSWSSQRLLFCADVEEGIGQRFEGASWLVPPLALGRLYQTEPDQALTLAERYGRCTADQARRCGLNWVLGPVCDVNNNPANPVINLRAWGENPATAGALASAFQRGLAKGNVLGCAKHFPGHGDTASDSHLDLPVLPHNLDRLNQVELPPFRDAIAAGVDSVMTAHLLLPNLDPEHPATLSPIVLTDLLRGDLGFDGLVVTDALVMEAIAARHGSAEAAVLAFSAGADLILMPGDADDAIDSLCAAITNGHVPPQRLEQSLERRRHALERTRPDSPGTTPIAMVTPEERQLEEELIARTLHFHGPPSIGISHGVNLVRVDSVVPNCSALNAEAPALALPSAQGFHPVVIHGQGVSPWQSTPNEPLALDRIGEGIVLLQLVLRGNPFRGSRDSHEPWVAAIHQLLAFNRLAGVIVYGSPYLWDNLQPLLPDDLPAAYSPGQMQDAQRQVLSRLLPRRGAKTGAFTD